MQSLQHRIMLSPMLMKMFILVSSSRLGAMPLLTLVEILGLGVSVVFPWQK